MYIAISKRISSTKKAYINPVISSMGYNRKWPLAMQYMLHNYGGLELKDPSTETVIIIDAYIICFPKKIVKISKSSDIVVSTCFKLF